MKDFASLSVYSKVTFIFQNLALTIAIFGVILNVFSILVLSRKNFKRHTFAFYIRLINAFDIFTLMTQFRYWLSDMFGIELKNVSIVLCKLADFSVYTTSTAAHYILVLITIDRFVSIAFPKRFALFQKRGFHICLVCLVCAYAFISLLPLAIFSELIVTEQLDNQTNTTVQTKACYLMGDANVFVHWISLVSPSLASLFISVLSVLTILSIYRSRSKLKRSKSTGKDLKFATTIIAQNITCIILKTPLSLFLLLNSYFNLDFEQFGMYFTIFLTIFSTENANSALVNFFFNSIFKNEVYDFLGIIRSKRGSNLQLSVSLSVSVKQPYL